FRELGLPTTRDEEWRYTNVEPFLAGGFETANGGTPAARTEEIVAASFMDPGYSRLTFINGVYAPALSFLSGVAPRVRIQSLAEAVKKNDPMIERHLTQYTRDREQAFTALNTAFTAEGALIHIPAGVVVDRPICLVYASIGNGRPFMSQPRNLVLLESGSQARIVESYVASSEQAYFTNGVTELVGGEGAVIDYYRVQREGGRGFHIGALEAHLEAQCQLRAHAITLSGALVRNHLHAVLAGEGAECLLNGLYVIDGKQHVDNYTEIEHMKPRATSLELYKGILGGSAHAVFNGKILVHKDAQKTNARQTNKNLLVSREAVVNTQPQLEIHADDVKCSHGSTIGQLDRDALFYLRSRGLDARDAQSLLTYAFASDVVGRIHIEPLRSRLDDYLLTTFGRT
ncbi:MAG TPA: Fe-S cluster assembly protein SufD, partial [Terriglobales bacterium]|nr:Fe-S cluster assembly protein SufD [Terriglobales bacterium]